MRPMMRTNLAQSRQKPKDQADLETEAGRYGLNAVHSSRRLWARIRFKGAWRFRDLQNRTREWSQTTEATSRLSCSQGSK